MPGQFSPDFLFHFVEHRQGAFHFFGKPSWMPAEMAAAAGLGLAIAIKESPVGGQPVLVPQGILGDDGFAECFITG